jgi:hypothetical protein
MQSPTQVQPPCLQVFGIPELACLICVHVQKRDNVSLLRVCRQLFCDIRPFVWEITDAIISLVSMIPGAGIFTDDDFLIPLAVSGSSVSLPVSVFLILCIFNLKDCAIP